MEMDGRLFPISFQKCIIHKKAWKSNFNLRGIACDTCFHNFSKIKTTNSTYSDMHWTNCNIIERKVPVKEVLKDKPGKTINADIFNLEKENLHLQLRELDWLEYKCGAISVAIKSSESIKVDLETLSMPKLNSSRLKQQDWAKIIY